MIRNGSFTNLEPKELFAEAVERMEAGDTKHSIVASYPAEQQEELLQLLTIVEVARQIRELPVPPPSMAKRLAAKQNFLNAAAVLRAQQQEAVAQPATQTRNVSEPSLFATLVHAAQQAVDTLQVILTVRTLRLAPLILLVALVLLTTSSLVTVAQAAVPGDLAYAFKQWIRKQELELAPADQRELVRLAQERELAEDVRRAAQKADHNAAVIRAEDVQTYYGRSGRLLKIGALNVMDRYQPDANIEQFKPMTIEGELAPGAQVAFSYQIMPGQSDTVQGIALRVTAPPSGEIATPIPTFTPESAGTQLQSSSEECAVSPPAGWVAYQVRVGDNLTFLASRGGVAIEELVAVNCLESSTILIGAVLYVPEITVEPGKLHRFCSEAIPENWVAHEVRIGDNLSNLAQRGGVTVEELMKVNCLQSTTILLGSTLYVPQSAESAP